MPFAFGILVVFLFGLVTSAQVIPLQKVNFNFDFATDAELVCTELVFKAYEPSQGMRGLRLPLVEMLGRKLLPANEIARQFDAQYGTAEAQFQFVIFLDGYERGRKAVEANVDQFRQSWRRPKWHVLIQKNLRSP